MAVVVLVWLPVWLVVLFFVVPIITVVWVAVFLGRIVVSGLVSVVGVVLESQQSVGWGWLGVHVQQQQEMDVSDRCDECCCDRWMVAGNM